MVCFGKYWPSVLKYIKPSFGMIHSKTEVFIELSNVQFIDGIQCKFGSTVVSAAYINLNQVVCYSPISIVESSVPIAVTFNGIDFHSGIYNCCRFKYVSVPKVLRIIPSYGIKSGGTKIKLKTKYLHHDSSIEILCSFESSGIVKPLEKIGNSVTCISPKMSGKKSVSVSVYYNVNVSVFPKLGGPIFTYVEAPVIKELIPNFGSINGGTKIKVHGDNFPNVHNLICLFGANSTVDAIFIDKQTISCDSPSSLVTGSVTVTILTKDDSFGLLSNHGVFEYLLHMSLHSIYPSSGSVRGGTRILLTGSFVSSQYRHRATCQFGDFIKYHIHRVKIYCATSVLI